ncbi:MAG: acetylhydrolase [Planctomycetes bacterium]|nr:acetylhydrolase [Planctomycetota bacterium]
MTDPSPAPAESARPRRDKLHLFWLAALAVIVLASVFFHFPYRAGPAAPPKWSGAWPGRGVVRVPGGWDDRRKEFWKSRERDRGAVAFVGDSITEWWADLAGAFPGLRVANRGIAGDVSRGVLFRLGEDVLDLEPRGVVILVGTNDLRFGGTPEDVAFNIAEMIREVEKRGKGTPVVICLVMPREGAVDLFPGKILALNALILKEAALKKGVAVCDTWAPFADERGLARDEEFPDLLHPNAKGYAKWAEALVPAMKEAGIVK